MTRGNVISAALLAAALAGAPAAYAATAGMTGTSANPTSAMKSQSSTMTNAALGASKATIAMTSKASGMPASSQAAKTGAKPAIRHIGLSEQVRAEDIAAFGSSKVTLDRAISAAERKLDGRAVEAVFRAEPGRPHYLIRIIKGDRVISAWVDASTGRVTHPRHSVALWRLYPGERTELIAADQSPAGLANAVAFAERQSGNRPIAARIERSEGTRAYDVATVSNGTLQSVWVSPENPMMMASK